jgi:flagellar basal body rod protein FlgG
MDPLTIAAASGLRSRMESLSLLANNLANAGTSGYKSDREFYGLYASSEAGSSADGNLQVLPVVERQWTDFSQGTIQATGNPLDVALSSRGFLVANAPGGPVYTRNGSLHISASGELSTGDGFAIRTADGGTIHVNSGKPIEISPDGVVRQDGNEIGRFLVVDFKSTSSLKKMSGSCFENTNAKDAPTPAANIEVLQGKLEGSNVAVPEAAMHLVGVMRQFEMLQKAVSMGVEMNSKAIQEVAHVGG